MPDCELLPSCLFFNDKLKNMPTSAAYFKKMFCRGNSSECARYIVAKALGRDKVPADLFPNETARARRLVAGE